jgi:DNA modification methylase
MAAVMDALKSESVPVTKLLGMGAPYNPRRIDADQLAALGRSMRTFGTVEPIVANRRSGLIVGGHQRVKAAEAEGIETLPVVWVDLDSTREKQLNLALNRISGEWDEPALARVLEELGSAAIDLTGFGSAEIDELIARMKREARAADPDDVPEPPVVPVSKTGDLYVLGKHRLLCGNSTNAAAVDRLLGEEKPFLLLTDPPYGVSLDMEWRDRAGINGLGPAQPSYLKRKEGHTNTSISGDTRADWSEAFELVPSLTVAYVWHASAFAIEVGTGLRRIGFELSQQIIWDKERLVLSRQHYHWQHEPCWYARKKGSPPFLGPRDQTTIWQARSPKMLMAGSQEEKVDHPTQKPVVLYTRPIENHLAIGEPFYEPFGGSGTGIIAAEKTGRRCLAMEIDPIFVDVIVTRWEKYTGEKAVLEAAPC